MLVHFFQLSTQVQKIVEMYGKSEFSDTKKDKFIAGIMNLNVKK